MDKLISIEVLIRSILFHSDKVASLPNTKDLEIKIQLGNRIDLHIMREMLDDNSEYDNYVKIFGENVIYSIYVGHSAVIPATTEYLRKLLTENAFELEIIDKSHPENDLGNVYRFILK